MRDARPLERRTTFRRGLWLLLAVFIVGFPAAALLKRSPQPLDDLGAAPSFQLTDQRGEAYSSEALRGRIAVVAFMFTSCPDICPMLSKAMVNLQERLADAPHGPSLMWLSISVDPERDTPAVLSEYATRYQADPATWRFLTGTTDDIEAAASGFMTAIARGSEGGEVPDISHSRSFIIIDAEGRIRGHFPTDPAGLNMIEGAIRRLKDA